MGVADAYLYNGKRVVVAGGATGMGRAVAELTLDAGAEVVVMDRAEITLDGVKKVELDLSDKASIDAAVDACGGPVHALFSCAGVADGTPGIEKINFLGHRHMIDRLLADGSLGQGGAIGMISSAAGYGWQNKVDDLNAYLDLDFDEASQWAQDNMHADYLWSKQAINCYVARQALPLLKQGIRINAIMPGPTDTPLAQANAEQWLGFASDYRDEVGIQPSTPLEQAYALVFLCSEAAAGVTGITLLSDAGYFSSGIAKSFPPATPAVEFMAQI